MEIWFILIATVCIMIMVNAIISLRKSNQNLPPGPRGIPIIRTISWLGKSSTDMEEFLRRMRRKFGPIVTLPIGTGSNPLVFVSSHSLAHQALVQHGAKFADRPKPPPTVRISNVLNINSSRYGPTWRNLRRNLTSQILHPSKSKEFSHARKWALEILISKLNNSKVASGDTGGAVKVIDHFRFAMFCLLVFMCFGDKLDESEIKKIETVLHKALVSFTRFQILNFWPWLTKIVLHSRWNELFELRKEQQKVLIPHIKARKELIQDENVGARDVNGRLVNSYVDSLLKLELSEDGTNNSTKRELSEEEVVTACTEFLSAGTDTTSTALQWIMANLVKNPEIQTRLYEEIKGVVGTEAREVAEDELSKMPYLKAVVLEGLRRHPPGHFVLPHSVTQEIELGGYTLPKNAIINFTVAEMGWDPEVWEDPMQFKPERFLSSNGQEEFDITGSREIKMMPFGAGRRICPGLGLALLHLEYFVANLVWNFEWSADDEVDLSEKQEFTIVMKNPLHAHISPRNLLS